MIDCVILAGGESSDLTSQEGVSNKGLLKIGNKEMVRFVLDVYQQLDEIGKVVLVGPEKEMIFLKEDYPIEILPESDTLIGNLILATRFFNTKSFADQFGRTPFIYR